MDKFYGIMQDAVRDRGLKIAFRKGLKRGLKDLFQFFDKLKTIDVEEFGKGLGKALADSARKAYAAGKLTEEDVEMSRRMSVIYGGKNSKSLYEMTRSLYELGKSQNDGENESG
jgi:hypothetical protein